MREMPPVRYRYPQSAAERADHHLLVALRRCGGDPYVAGAARALSWTGEHGGIWLAAGLAGACADPRRRTAWLRATALVGAAHAASMTVKRVVRRPRPQLPGGAAPLVRTAAPHSFPSSHATSAAAAVVAFAPLLPRAPLPPLAAAMCLSRLVVGVHYPTDVACGALLGATTAALGRRWAHGAPPPPGGSRGALPAAPFLSAAAPLAGTVESGGGEPTAGVRWAGLGVARLLPAAAASAAAARSGGAESPAAGVRAARETRRPASGLLPAAGRTLPAAVRVALWAAPLVSAATAFAVSARCAGAQRSGRHRAGGPVGAVAGPAAGGALLARPRRRPPSGPGPAPLSGRTPGGGAV